MAARLTQTSRGYTLVLLLLLAVLVPSACLLWFMSQAVQNERLAVRQKLIEAYRGNLALVQDRLQKHLQEKVATARDELATNSPAQVFADAVTRGGFDSVIVLDEAGQPLYPNYDASSAAPAVTGDTSEWILGKQLELTDPKAAAAVFGKIANTATEPSTLARALQAQGRSLAKAGQREAALAILVGQLSEARLRDVRDTRGNLNWLNAEFMALELMAEQKDERFSNQLARLCSDVADYKTNSIPSRQRIFVMRELAQRFTNEAAFPTQKAEELALQYLETAPRPRPGDKLQGSGLADVWQIGSTDHRVLFLYRTQTLVAQLAQAIPAATLPRDVTLRIVPPGPQPNKTLLSVDVGGALPDWKVGLVANGAAWSDTAAEQRIASYIWISALVLATVITLALFIMRVIRRQMALTQLRTDLVTNVTHELKTPLSSMRLLVDTLLDSPKWNEQTAREYLQLIATENLRLSRLIDNFLTFSRIERNKYTFTFAPHTPVELVESAVAVVQERFATPNCKFDVQVEPGLPAVTADADAMVTALVNLLDNAWKYSGEMKEIRFTAARRDAGIAFTVTDNGVGLPPRQTKRIFKRFYQVDQTLARTTGGCGLGLSIVQFIVDAHKGQVQVDSKPGAGSTFTILLPSAEALKASDAEAARQVSTAIITPTNTTSSL
jgi:signal transduction histidine kinase